MGSVTFFKSRVGKVIFSQTTGRLCVITPLFYMVSHAPGIIIETMSYFLGLVIFQLLDGVKYGVLHLILTKFRLFYLYNN